MKSEIKRWTHLGLSGALAGSVFLAACSQEAGNETPEAPPVSSPAVEEPADQAPVAANDGGEGEGGVAIDRASTDPVVFRSALAITEAHIIAARDAFLQGETNAAGEMFAHPVSEVLLDVGPHLQAQGVENFDDLLVNASGAVFEGETEDQISARTDEIIATLRAAAEKAPDNGQSEARIQAGVASDQIDRAATMYALAGEGDEYEPYLDGYGFFKAAQAAYDLQKTAINADLPEAATAIEAALTLLAKAYPTALRPETLDQQPAALTAASSGVILALGN